MEKTEYLPGYKPSQIGHHEWRTAENSATHLLPHLSRLYAHIPDLQLLDVGTGSGTIATSLSKYMPPGGHITATDVSEEILQRARLLASKMNVNSTKVHFEQASIFQLPYQDSQFDVTHVHQVLCHLKSPVPALKELLRVTKPGGVVAVRESDLDLWSFWPDYAGITKYHSLLLRVHHSAGGQSDAGRRLLSWALDAGCDRDQVDMKFAGWTYNTAKDRAAIATAMIERVVSGNMRLRASELDPDLLTDIDEMVADWTTWMNTEAATLGMMQGEMIIHKRATDR